MGVGYIVTKGNVPLGKWVRSNKASMQYEEERNSEELQASRKRRAAKETIAVISCSVTNYPQTWQLKSTNI